MKINLKSQNINISDNLGEKNDETYDKIQFLKINENDGLLRGVWSKPLIEPDWNSIIDICTKELETKRDLVLAAFLTEGLLYKHKLIGLETGINIIIEIMKNNEFYPIDQDERDIIYNWINSNLNKAYLIILNNEITELKDNITNKNINDNVISKLNENILILQNLQKKFTNLNICNQLEESSTQYLQEFLLCLDKINNIINKDINNKKIEEETKINTQNNNNDTLKENQDNEQIKQKIIELLPEITDNIKNILFKKFNLS